MSFSGRFSSPMTKPDVCQPPYAKRTGTIAAPKAVTRSNETGRSSAGASAARSPPKYAKPTATSIAIAAIFSTMKTAWTSLPARTPRRFTTVSVARAAMAIAPSPSGTDHCSRR